MVHAAGGAVAWPIWPEMHQIGAPRVLCRAQSPRPAPGPHRRHDGTQPGPGVGPNAPAPGPALRRPSHHPRMARQRQIIMTYSAVSRPVTARTARRPGARSRLLFIIFCVHREHPRSFGVALKARASADEVGHCTHHAPPAPPQSPWRAPRRPRCQVEGPGRSPPPHDHDHDTAFNVNI